MVVEIGEGCCWEDIEGVYCAQHLYLGANWLAARVLEAQEAHVLYEAMEVQDTSRD